MRSTDWRVWCLSRKPKPTPNANTGTSQPPTPNATQVNAHSSVPTAHSSHTD
ncbi:MAG: hypothetical protein V4569_02470 [Pseudomonadota bacterium]